MVGEPTCSSAARATHPVISIDVDVKVDALTKLQAEFESNIEVSMDAVLLDNLDETQHTRSTTQTASSTS